MSAVAYLILGAGGAGRTVAGACAHLAGNLGFLDDHATTREVNGIPILGTLAARAQYRAAQYIVAFGSRYQTARRDVFAQWRAEGLRFFTVIAPQAYVDRDAEIGAGVFIAAQCAVLPNARIGDNCNLCVACTVDHDAVWKRASTLRRASTLPARSSSRKVRSSARMRRSCRACASARGRRSARARSFCMTLRRAMSSLACRRARSNHSIRIACDSNYSL